MPKLTPRPLLLMAACALFATLAGCGGGSKTIGGSSSGGSSGGTVVNSVPVSVESGPGAAPNTLYTTVTVCAHGSSTNCQTIDHVQVDTGSSGFRVLSSIFTVTGLTPTTDSSGNAIVECALFADGYSWGPVETVDLTVGGLTATSIPIQVIGASNFQSVPSSCSTNQAVGEALTQEDTPTAFGANGILGIGFFAQDCGPYCASSSNTQVQNYYSCTSAQVCTPTTLSTTLQVQNPVPLFSSNNNGVAIKLAAVSAPGAATVAGTLFFGIGTESNNTLTASALYAVYSSTSSTGEPGTFISAYKGTNTTGFIDSGSNGLFFTDASIPACPAGNANGFYCPSGTLNLSATIQGVNTGANSTTVSFSIDNATTLFGDSGGTNFALPTLGGTAGTSTFPEFDWGIPFFYNRTVFYALENASVPGTASVGPWVGF